MQNDTEKNIKLAAVGLVLAIVVFGLWYKLGKDNAPSDNLPEDETQVVVESEPGVENNDSEPPLRSYDTQNLLNRFPGNSTTTAVSRLPVLILSRDLHRRYAYIINDSDTAVYLTFSNFSDATAASTTAGVDGLRLNASGGSYEILEENLWQGDIWASSSLSGKKILFASSTKID